MVTLPLERMASRVAASLCYATGLGPEMVVNSQVSCFASHAESSSQLKPLYCNKSCNWSWSQSEYLRAKTLRTDQLEA